MKHLPALIVTALMALTVPGAQAETKQCACNCQCETSSAPTVFRESRLAIPKPPPPTVVEAQGGELDLQTLGAADATVELTYPEIADGHTAGLYWTSGIQQYRAPVQTVSGGAKSVIFKIPNDTVVKDLGQSPVLTASVGVGDESLVISQPQNVKVIDSTPTGQYPPPTLPGIADNLVDIGALTGDLPISVHYPPIMAQGQIVKVLWRGATSYDTPMKVTPDGNPLQFTIPHATVLESLGKDVSLKYEVALDGQVAVPSDPVRPQVILKTLQDIPAVPSADQGQVDLKNLAGRPLTVTYNYPGIAAGHTAGIRWAGNPVYDTPHPPIGATPRPLAFTIPYDKVKLEKDKTVLITASVGIGDGRLAVSPALSLNVVDTRPSGEQIAADLNARYNDTRAVCDNNQPSYYCNGVTTRGTDNSNFDPWDPSPTQQRKGSVSFSHLRKDSKVTLLSRNSGYALLSQEEAIKQGKQKEYLCAYPHDAWTDIVGRPGSGCGFQTKENETLINFLRSHPQWVNVLRDNEELAERLASNQDPTNLLNNDPRLAELLKSAPELKAMLVDNEQLLLRWKKEPQLADMSTCATVNATTPATWYAYSSKLTHYAYQCSLSANNAAQYSTSLAARGYSIPAIQTSYNELLIRVWTTGTAAQLPLQAFYYQNPTGLPEAKVYQQKFAARTGGTWLPVIKLDMTKLGGNPFSYNPGDQAIQP